MDGVKLVVMVVPMLLQFTLVKVMDQENTSILITNLLIQLLLEIMEKCPFN
jgi:hypothetical protein